MMYNEVYSVFIYSNAGVGQRGAFYFLVTVFIVTFHAETLDDPVSTNLIFRGIIIVCDVKVILWGSALTV